MAIAELFYPKELKEIVADLRAKDDLNELALKSLKFDLYTFYMLWLIGVFIAFYNLEFELAAQLSVSGILLLVLFSRWIIRNRFYTCMAAYLFGEEMDAVVMQLYRRSGTHLTRDVNDVKVYVHRLNTALRIGTLQRMTNLDIYPKKDEKLTIFVSRQKKYKPVLGTEFYRKHHCLSNAIIKGSQ